MKKVTWLVVLALMVSMIAMPAMAEGTYAQAPMFDEKVESGELAPVEERLPEEPKLAHEILDEYLDMEIGNYGGTLRLTTSVVNWDADGFIGMNEGLMSMSSTNSGEIIPNVLGGCEVNDDMTEFLHPAQGPEVVRRRRSHHGRCEVRHRKLRVQRGADSHYRRLHARRRPDHRRSLHLRSD